MKKIVSLWKKEDVNKNAKKYIELYQTGNIDDHFSWVLKEDQEYLKPRNSIRWGVPTVMSGNIDNAKVIIGLLNPSINMPEKADISLKSVREYVELEVNSFKKGKYFINEEINDEYNDDEKWYFGHIFSELNIFSEEMLQSYRNYINNGKTSINLPYYLSNYFNGLFIEYGKESGKRNLENFCKELFDKITNEEELEEKLKNVPICNIELLPYRSKNIGDIKFKKGTFVDVPSARYTATVLITKMINDKEVIVILRGLKKYWLDILIDVSKSMNVNFEKEISNRLYSVDGEKVALSPKIIKSFKDGNSSPEISNKIREIIINSLQ